ncbi:hypothetical protein U1Q18_000650, partial [Sarracenia purpurea var. burkii]
ATMVVDVNAPVPRQWRMTHQTLSRDRSLSFGFMMLMRNLQLWQSNKLRGSLVFSRNRLDDEPNEGSESNDAARQQNLDSTLDQIEVSFEKTIPEVRDEKVRFRRALRLRLVTDHLPCANLHSRSLALKFNQYSRSLRFLSRYTQSISRQLLEIYTVDLFDSSSIGDEIQSWLVLKEEEENGEKEASN